MRRQVDVEGGCHDVIGDEGHAPFTQHRAYPPQIGAPKQRVAGYLTEATGHSLSIKQSAQLRFDCLKVVQQNTADPKLFLQLEGIDVRKSQLRRRGVWRSAHDGFEGGEDGRHAGWRQENIRWGAV